MPSRALPDDAESARDLNTVDTATQVESESPAATFISPDRPSYKWWVAATMMLSAFLVISSGAMVNVALPPMMTALSLNLDQAQWIITAYMIAGAVLIPTVGWLGNRLGNRNLFLVSIIVFIIGAILCGFAWSGPSLIFFRVVQGIGSGAILPMAMVYLNDAFPANQRGLAMGLFGMASAFGPAVAPVIGGYVTEFMSWRMVFYLNVLPGIIAMVLGTMVIPSVRESHQRSLDFPGLITLTVFIVSLLIALTQGQRYGWDDALIRRLFLIAGASCAAFIIIELTRREPLVELRLYKNIGFAVVSFAILLNALNFWGTNFLQTILLQRLFDYTPAQAGYATLPGALLMSFTTMYAGKLADQIDRRYVILFGLATFGLASWAFSTLTLDRSMNWVILMILGRYLTIGFVYTPMNAASLMTLPPDQVRMGSGLINIMQQGIGGTVGLAIMTTMLQRRTTYHASMLDQHQVTSALPWFDVFTPAWELMRSAGEVGALVEIKASALLQHHLLQQATVAAYADCFMLVAVLCFVAMVPICFIRRYQEG